MNDPELANYLLQAAGMGFMVGMGVWIGLSVGKGIEWLIKFYFIMRRNW